jgi:hypothetical protein
MLSILAGSATLSWLFGIKVGVSRSCKMESGNSLLATIYLCSFCFPGLDLDTHLFSHNDTTMFDVIDIEMSTCCRFGYIKSLNLRREIQ